MQTPEQLIGSGILERFVLGLAAPEEATLVTEMANSHPDVALELQEIEIALEKLAFSNALQPNPSIRALLLAGIDFTARMEKGEPILVSPLLTEATTLDAFSDILLSPTFADPQDLGQITVKIIDYTPEKMQALVWATEIEVTETHGNEFESFLVVEGSCEIRVNGQANTMFPGDYLAIPLHAAHTVKVHKGGYCKVILQRKAA